MYLFINNLNENKITLVLIKKDKIFRELCLPVKAGQNENILRGIDKLLKQASPVRNRRFLSGVKKRIKNIRGIIVVNGPGRFTSIRVALSAANTLGWVLKIPVVAVNLREGAENEELIKRGLAGLTKTKKFRAASPFYGKEPNIG